MANRVRDLAKERFWRGALKRCAASGLNVRTFCRRERLSEASFYAWRRTIAERAGEKHRTVQAIGQTRQPQQVSRRASLPRVGCQPPPSFLPVIVSSRESNGVAITIELAGGRLLRLPETICAARFSELVAALEAGAAR